METKHKEFKPYDKVLVRWREKWFNDFYSFWDKESKNHIVLNFAEVKDDKILPYEGNEHLVGQVNEPDEEVKLEEGEFIICFDSIAEFDEPDLLLSRFQGVEDEAFEIRAVGHWYFAIRVSDFNPNDMEETRKHILCVKNGKIVKYKPE